MDVQLAYDNGPHVFLWACSLATRGKMTVGRIPNGQQHYEILNK